MGGRNQNNKHKVLSWAGGNTATSQSVAIAVNHTSNPSGIWPIVLISFLLATQNIMLYFKKTFIYFYMYARFQLRWVWLPRKDNTNVAILGRKIKIKIKTKKTLFSVGTVKIIKHFSSHLIAVSASHRPGWSTFTVYTTLKQYGNISAMWVKRNRINLSKIRPMLILL